MTKSKRLQVWINPDTHGQLLEFLKDDSNRILGAKIQKGGAVDLGLQLLLNARKTMSLEEIYHSCNGSSDGDA